MANATKLKSMQLSRRTTSMPSKGDHNRLLKIAPQLNVDVVVEVTMTQNTADSFGAFVPGHYEHYQAKLTPEPQESRT